MKIKSNNMQQYVILILLMLVSTASAEPFNNITNFDSSNVSLIDAATNTFIATMPVESSVSGETVNPICPPGTNLSGGRCVYDPVEPCPADTSFDSSTGMCVYYPAGADCPEHYFREGSVCVRPQETPECLPDYVLEGSECVRPPVEPQCDAGTIFDSSIGQCTYPSMSPECPSDSVFDWSTGQCTYPSMSPECPTNDFDENGDCINPACPPGYNLEDGPYGLECVRPPETPACPLGYNLEAGPYGLECVRPTESPKCPLNSNLDLSIGMCVYDPVEPQCPEGLFDSSTSMCGFDPVEPQCPQYYVPEGFVCVRPPDIPECPQYYDLKGSVCVRPPDIPECPQGFVLSEDLCYKNLIKNPGFESKTAPWIFYTNGTGNFKLASPGYEGNYSAMLTILSVGTNMQLYQKDISLEPNTRYRLSFAAKSSSGRDMNVRLIKHGSPFTYYGFAQRFDLSNSWQEYSITFTTTGFKRTVNDGRLMFYFNPYAIAGDKYYIDNVQLMKI